MLELQLHHFRFLDKCTSHCLGYCEKFSTVFILFHCFLKENSISCKKKSECNKLRSSSVPMNDNSFTARNLMSSTIGESRAVGRNSISGSGSSHLKLEHRLQPLKFLALAEERFGPLQTKKHCIIYRIGLFQKLCLLNRNSKFRFRLRLHH